MSNVPLHGFGGGGAGLNFKVIACASAEDLPDSARENTIAVITETAINGYIFSSTEPTAPAEGMVWFLTGTGSRVAFSASKKNPVMVYPLSAKQYVGGAWVDVPAKSYQNGAWVDWIVSYYLFKSGVGEVVPISITVDSGQKFTQSEESIVFSSSASADYGYGVCTEEAHDLTGYSQLCIEHAISNYGSCRIGVYTEFFTHSSASADIRPAELVLTKSTERIVEKLDISAFDGAYYLGFNGGKIIGSVYNFWLE